MQVVRGRMRLHADSDAISTTPPRPLHFNVGLDEAPHVQEDKIMQVNIEMWGGGEFLRDRGGLIHIGTLLLRTLR